MSSQHDSFDSDLALSRCSCGHHDSQAAHDLEMAAREHYRLQLCLVEVEHRTSRIAQARPPLPELTALSEWPGRRTRTLH